MGSQAPGDRGFLDIGGSHTLERFANQVARDIEDPDAKVSVWQRLQAARIVTGGAKHGSRPTLNAGY